MIRILLHTLCDKFGLDLDIIRPDIRQDFADLFGKIRQGMPDNPAEYSASGKIKQIRPNPNKDIVYKCV